MHYNWQQKDWPKFHYDLSGVVEDLTAFEKRSDQTSRVFRALPEKTRHETILDMMVTEAVKTSAIEGEYISQKEVMSSIRNQLGLNIEPEQVKDPRAKGAAQLMLSLRNTFEDKLTDTLLFHWHRMLLEYNNHIVIGAWRRHQEPMQVVSGMAHAPTIHFEAPPSKQVPHEMARYVAWFNTGANTIASPLVRSAIAHLYFESIHPFEDGNGRIGRALSEKILSQGLGHPILVSLSKAIETHKKSYYQALESAQKSHEITPWIHYFVQMALNAQMDSETLIDFILKKARFHDRYQGQFNAHQLKAINRMLDEGPKGFEGGMSAKKYAKITGVSKATATRHLQQLKALGAFTQQGSGRATGYQVNFE